METHNTSICWEYQAEVEEPWTAFKHSEQVLIQEARRRGSDELHLKSLQLLLFFSNMTAIGANNELKLRERRRSEQEEVQYISKLAVEAELRSERQKRWFDGTRIYMNKVTIDDGEDEQPKPSVVDLSEDETDGLTSTGSNEVSIVQDLLELRDLQYVLASTYSSSVGYLYEHLTPEVEVTPILGMISSPGSGSGYKTKARFYDFHDGHPPAFCPSVAKWGVFHAKLLLLSSPTKLRVVISSANIARAQFAKQSQNLWVCDFAVKAAGARTSTFARGLEQFVSSMLSVDYRQVDGGEKGAAGVREVEAWADRAKERWLGELRRFDLSPPPNVHLVASIPFADNGGVKRLASILDSSTLPLYDSVAYQHTSFGKLDKMFLADLKAALRASDGDMQLEVVWPSYSSALTRRGKGNLCLSEAAFARIKELRLDTQFRELVASTPSHSGTLSHGKVIVAYKREDLPRLAFIYCGSHNMSIAAWGSVNRKPNSFELGVLMIAPGPNHVSLPFQLPPPSYPPGEQPYILPVYYREAFGRTDEDVREELETAAALYDKLAVADQPRPRAITRSLNSLAAESAGPRLLLILSGSPEDHDRDHKVVSLLCDAELTHVVDGSLGGVVVCVGSRGHDGRVVTYGQHLCSFTTRFRTPGIAIMLPTPGQTGEWRTWQLVEAWSKWDDVGEFLLKSSSHLSNKLAAHLAVLAAPEAKGHATHPAAAGQQFEAQRLEMATAASTVHPNVGGGSCGEDCMARCRTYGGEEDDTWAGQWQRRERRSRRRIASAEHGQRPWREEVECSHGAKRRSGSRGRERRTTGMSVKSWWLVTVMRTFESVYRRCGLFVGGMCDPRECT